MDPQNLDHQIYSTSSTISFVTFNYYFNLAISSMPQHNAAFHVRRTVQKVPYSFEISLCRLRLHANLCD